MRIQKSEERIQKKNNILVVLAHEFYLLLRCASQACVLATLTRNGKQARIETNEN
jgi:hypothetical protein